MDEQTITRIVKAVATALAEPATDGAPADGERIEKAHGPGCNAAGCTCGDTCTCTAGSCGCGGQAVDAGQSGRERMQITVQIAKASDVDLRLGVIYGVASSLSYDKQGHAVKNDYELEAAAVRFMEKQVMRKAQAMANDSHEADIDGTWVASWVSDGTWRVGFKPADIEIARAAARGEYTGFSIEGWADMEDAA